MNTIVRRGFPILLGLGACLLPLLAQVLRASSVSLELASFPVNLGGAADPAAIPLGEAPLFSNYGFGEASAVVKPMAISDGGWEWARGTVTNLNLASEFGIFLETPDELMLTSNPTILRVKSWPRPSYSPYTRQQVVAATIVALLHNFKTDAEKPLTIKMVVENPDERAALEPLSGPYALGKEGLTTGSLPGVIWKREEDGVVRVRFPDVKAVAVGTPPRLGFVPVWESGEGEGDTLYFVSRWTNGSPLDLAWTALPRERNDFSAKKKMSINPVHASDDLYCSSTKWTLGEANSVSINPGRLRVGPYLERDFAAAVWSMVLTDAVNGGSGLKISFSGMGGEHPLSKAALTGWSEVPDVNSPSPRYETTFRYDLKAGRLEKGSLGGWTVIPRSTGGWDLVESKRPEQAPPAGE